MKRFDKIKNIQRANLLAEQRYLTSKGGEFDSVGQAYSSPMLGVNEELDKTGLLEDNYSVDQLVTMVLESEAFDLGELDVTNAETANFSRRYSDLYCVKFNANLPITVKFSSKDFYTLTFNFKGYCDEDPDGPSIGTYFSVKLTDTSYDSNLFGKDLSDMVSDELSKELNEIEKGVVEYMYYRDHRDDY